MQNFYNVLYCDEEMEMNPFCRAEGIELMPWSSVARDLLTRPWNVQTTRSQQDVKSSKWFVEEEQNKAIVDRVEALAKQKGCTMVVLSVA